MYPQVGGSLINPVSSSMDEAARKLVLMRARRISCIRGLFGFWLGNGCVLFFFLVCSDLWRFVSASMTKIPVCLDVSRNFSSIFLGIM